MQPNSITPYRAAPVRSKRRLSESAHSPGMYSNVSTITRSARGILIRKMLGQPILCVSTPPMNGPRESPAYTVAVIIPIARPRSPGGKTEVTIAIDVEKTIAPPSAWMTRAVMMMGPDHEIAARREPIAKRIFPSMKNFFRPYISASLPNGTMQIAAVSKYAYVTQPSVTASISNDALMAGKATFKEETVYGTRKDASEATTRRTRFSLSWFMERDVGCDGR